MVSLLGLDLATTSGWAHWRDGMAKPRAGTLKLPDGGEIGPWLNELYGWVLNFSQVEGVTDIAIETPMTTAGDQNKIFRLVSAAGIVQMIGAQISASVKLVANSSMIAHWLGSNNFHGPERKTRSVLAAQQKGWNVHDHNIADALGVLNFRAFQLGLDTPWDCQKAAGPLFEGAPQGTRITKDNKVAGAKLLNKALSFDRSKPEVA